MATTITVLLVIVSVGAGPASAVEPATANEAAPAARTAEPPPAEPEALAPATAVAPTRGVDPLELRPRSVVDLGGLEKLSALDVQLRQRYDGLASRRNGATLAFGGAVAGTTVAGILAAFESFKAGLAGPASCTFIGTVGTQAGVSCQPARANYTPALVTLGVSVALVGIGVAMLPRRSDIAGAVSLWNARHPDAPVVGPSPEATAAHATATEPSYGVYTPPGW